jgi:hypothetical protein
MKPTAEPNPQFADVYAKLRALMLESAAGMRVAEDGPGGLVMHAPIPHPYKPKEPMWFGAVQVGKAYVSYHLMPVYMNPAMQAQITPALKKRMQGKACFNFKAADEALFEDLRALTAAGAEAFSKPLNYQKGKWGVAGGAGEA